MQLVGYNDLQGGQALQVTTKSDAANGNLVYVGLSPNDRDDPQESDNGQGNDQLIQRHTDTTAGTSARGDRHANRGDDRPPGVDREFDSVAGIEAAEQGRR